MIRFLHSARWRAVWRPLSRALLALEVIGVLVLIALGAVIARYGAHDHAAPADLIVVLGGGQGGTERRTEHGVALYRQGYAPVLLCSGGAVTPRDIAEANRCAAAALEAGVPADAILTELESRSTEENAIAAQAIMQAHGWDTALIVTDDYHLWRAHWLFERQGIHTYASPAQITTGPLGTVEEARAVVREVLAVGWYVGKQLLGLPYTDFPPRRMMRP